MLDRPQLDASGKGEGQVHLGHGRSREDFGPLRPAELGLADAVRLGQWYGASELDWHDEDDLKKLREDDAFHVRASFLRFLALGGDADTPVHEKGVRLYGAFIVAD